MAYLKSILSALAAIVLAELIPGLWWAFKNTNGSKATGIAVIPAELVGSLLTPRFWILSILFFVLFLLASRVTNKSLRVIAFWIPTVSACCAGIGVAALFTYVLVRFTNS
jgi:hypothetical protein